MNAKGELAENLAPTPKESRKSIPAHLVNAERRHGNGRFMALIEPIRSSLNAGLSRIVVYEKHHALLGMSYSQFARYVARHIKSSADLPESPVPVAPPITATSSASRPVSNASTVAIGLPRFNYDPTIPKERLI